MRSSAYYINVLINPAIFEGTWQRGSPVCRRMIYRRCSNREGPASRRDRITRDVQPEDYHYILFTLLNQWRTIRYLLYEKVK